MYKIVSWVYEMKNRKSIRNINRLQNGNKGGKLGSSPLTRNKKRQSFLTAFVAVLPLGLEPRTPTLRVSCSTN